MIEVSSVRVSLWALACAGSLALPACLSIDNITVREEEPDAGGDGAADGDGGSDGDAGSPEPVACIDRGTYEIDEISVQGLAATCQGDSICIDGLCVDEPTCAPGVTTACRIPQIAVGRRMTAPVAIGDSLYWTELGSTDQLGNYRQDGALVRMKVGSWQREELLQGLDFYYDQTQSFGNGMLTAAGDWLFVPLAEDGTGLVRSADGAHSYRVPDHESRTTCLGSDGSFFVARDVEGGPVVVTRYDGLTQVERTLPFYHIDRCVVADGVLWAARSGKLTRLDFESGEKRVYTSILHLVAVQDDLVVQEERGLYRVAQLGESTTLTWTNRAGGTSTSFDGPVLRGDEIFWARLSAYRSYATIFRASLRETVAPVIVAEMHDVAITHAGEGDGIFTLVGRGDIVAADSGILWTGLNPADESYDLHFVPLPAAASQRAAD